MDRSVYTALIGLFRDRPRELAIKRADIQARLRELCGVEVHVRDIQSLVDHIAASEHWCIISEARGYWRLSERASAEELEAAEHSVNTLRAHAEAELEKANLRVKWIDLIRELREHPERQNARTTQQERLFL
ncbi:hypothetical protein KKH18_06870 [bacterium]|nr:hypothetical protein [bacterium]